MLFYKRKATCLLFAILLNVLGQNDAASVRLYLGSFDKFKEVLLSSSESLMPYIEPSKNVTVYTGGFRHDPDNGTAIRTVVSTLIQTNNTVILLNWKNEANPGLGLLGYCTAVKNIDTVAKGLADALVKMIQLGLNKNISLIGHSLGASLMGLTGRYTQQQNVTIPWVIALDAASNLCNLYRQVDKTSGRTVVFVRTDPGGMGTNESTAHIDFRPNYGAYVKGSRLQPGCSKGYSDVEVAANGNLCSHDRAWMYLCEALLNPGKFILGLAISYYDFVTKNGTFTTINYLSPVDASKQGEFYCTTSATSPFSKEYEGLYP